MVIALLQPRKALYHRRDLGEDVPGLPAVVRGGIAFAPALSLGPGDMSEGEGSREGGLAVAPSDRENRRPDQAPAGLVGPVDMSNELLLLRAEPKVGPGARSCRARRRLDKADDTF